VNAANGEDLEEVGRLGVLKGSEDKVEKAVEKGGSVCGCEKKKWKE